MNFTELSAQDPIVIVGAKRTAIGSFMGSFADVPAHKLGEVALRAAMADAGVPADDIDEVILGQVLVGGAGQNPARQAAMAAGIAQERTAFGISQVCGSGLRAVALAAQSLLCGDARIIAAGGQESMSMAPHAAPLRAGVKFGDLALKDTMIVDGLWDVFNDYHMGITAENIAEKFGVSRRDQDEFSAQSQQRAEAAMASGAFVPEIAPLTVKVKKDDKIIDTDEFPRKGVTADSLGALKPAFKKDGTVTAGNASGLNDGAAALVLMRASEAQKRGLRAYARIVSWAVAGVDPAIMGTGPIPASRRALDMAGWSVGDLDLIESNEAFAAQACCVVKELGFDTAKVNVNGGAIALGHPIGASGARVLVTLLHEMTRRNSRKGLATLCIGGGMGIAMTVSREDISSLNINWKEGQ